MNGFLVLTLACAFFISVECEGLKKRSPSGPVYDGLNEIIDDAVQQADLVAADVAERLNETLHSIKNKVDHLRDTNAFTRNIELMKSQGGPVQKCLKNHELATAQFMRKLVNTYDSCSKDLKHEVNGAVKKVSEQVSIIKGASKRLEGIRTECTAAEMNAGASVLCAVTHIAEIKEEIFEASQKVEMFFAQEEEYVDTFANTKCQGIEVLKNEFDSLNAKIETCVKSK